MLISSHGVGAMEEVPRLWHAMNETAAQGVPAPPTDCLQCAAQSISPTDCSVYSPTDCSVYSPTDCTEHKISTDRTPDGHLETTIWSV